MPIKQSGKEELRKAKKRRIFNLRRQKAMKEAVKKVKKTTIAKGKKEAGKLISTAYKAIDKALKRGIIKKNTASRKKSRLMKMLNASK